MNASIDKDELSNMIEMLEEQLEWFRRRENPKDNLDHKYHRMFLTLAKAIHQLRQELTKEMK